MALKITTKQAKVTETKQLKNKSEIISEEVAEKNVALPPEIESSQGAAGPWCEVGVDASFTKNLGNFQSSRVGVSLRVPCLHSEVDDVFDYTVQWVDKKMEELMSED